MTGRIAAERNLSNELRGAERPTSAADITAAIAHRAAANEAFFAADAIRIAELSSLMAERFTLGGRLIAIGLSPSARSDMRHVAVEFVHPVIVGKRALPAFALSADGRDTVGQVGLLSSRNDVLLAFGPMDSFDDSCLNRAVGQAQSRGCLTIAFDAFGADVELVTPGDAFARQECVETLYHVLWELVHLFLEHGDGTGRLAAHPGQSAFLYPFLADVEVDRRSIVVDAARSVVEKSRDASALRARAFSIGDADELVRAAAEVRQRLDAGGVVLAFGNGGSATDAMDLVADLRTPPAGLALTPRRALDLTEDSSILSALSNDVGPDLMFTRQIGAFGRPNDVAVAFSTSGNSRNVAGALEAARTRGLLTIAFTGYDGGVIARERLADYVFNAPSEYVPRIQEAHATGYHLLRLLIG